MNKNYQKPFIVEWQGWKLSEISWLSLGKNVTDHTSIAIRLTNKAENCGQPFSFWTYFKQLRNFSEKNLKKRAKSRTRSKCVWDVQHQHLGIWGSQWNFLQDFPSSRMTWLESYLKYLSKGELLSWFFYSCCIFELLRSDDSFGQADVSWISKFAYEKEFLLSKTCTMRLKCVEKKWYGQKVKLAGSCANEFTSSKRRISHTHKNPRPEKILSPRRLFWFAKLVCKLNLNEFVNLWILI